ncbi:MAG: OsmC family protein [Nitrospinae bacterium]|nr:OsmC family protein [Nitrospinota bacterium]
MESKRDLKTILERRRVIFGQKPETARYVPKVVTQWKGGLRNENAIRNHTVVSDYPVPSGGADAAANPMELLLAALGSCVSAVYVEYAALLDVTLDGVTVELEGEIDLRGLFNVAAVESGFQSITYTVRLETGAPREKVDELIRLADEHCPVSDSLKRQVAVNKSVAVA